MSRFARRVDANQAAVVDAFRRAGASVLHLHAVGGGCADLLIGIAGVDVQVEVKDGRKPPSDRKLTPLEAKHHATWRGRRVELVECPEDALQLVSRVMRGAP